MNQSIEWALAQFQKQKFDGSADTLIVAGVMMENCSGNDRITWQHGYRFLDFPGVIAEFGARILYIETKRDEQEFTSDKSNWTRYLVHNGYLRVDPNAG